MYESMRPFSFQLLQSIFFRGIEVLFGRSLSFDMILTFVSCKNGQWKNHQWNLIPMIILHISVKIVFRFPSVKRFIVYYIFKEIFRYSMFFHISSFKTESNTKKQSMLILLLISSDVKVRFFFF